MKESQLKRKENLLPGNVPKWIRCFDNGGKTADKYTVVFTHAHSFGMRGYTVGIGMSANPFHPQGVGMHFEYPNHVYNGRSGGKRITYQDLPEDCQRLVMSDYMDCWGLND